MVPNQPTTPTTTVRTDFVGNEVSLDYNAGFTGTGSSLCGIRRPTARQLPHSGRGSEFFVQASINQAGPGFTEIRALLNNRSAWPARSSSNLGFRYFVDLTEVYKAGYSVNDIQVGSNYSQGATIGNLLPWDAAKHIYYVDVRFTGVPIGPVANLFSKEAQLRIGVKNGVPTSIWDPTNDWSYQGISTSRDNPVLDNNIPVYEFGATSWGGLEPGSFNPELQASRSTTYPSPKEQRHEGRHLHAQPIATGSPGGRGHLRDQQWHRDSG